MRRGGGSQHDVGGAIQQQLRAGDGQRFAPVCPQLLLQVRVSVAEIMANPTHPLFIVSFI
jgi:hypothetical protein